MSTSNVGLLEPKRKKKNEGWNDCPTCETSKKRKRQTSPVLSDSSNNSIKKATLKYVVYNLMALSDKKFLHSKPLYIQKIPWSIMVKPSEGKK